MAAPRFPDMFSWLHDWFWIQQDYFWFLAGIGWLTVGLLWWRQRPSGGMPGWVPWSAATGVAIAIAQVAILMTPAEHPVPYKAFGMAGDMWLGFILAVQACGWWTANLRHRRAGLLLFATIALVALIAAAWRYVSPGRGALVIAAISMVGIAWLVISSDAGIRRWSVAVGLTGLAGIVNASGPIFAYWQGSQRWWDLHPGGSWSALAQCVAAGATLGIWWHDQRSDRPTKNLCRPERLALASVSAWLAFGMVLAIAVGSWGHQSFRKSALGRVRAAAAMMPLEDVRNLLDERFVLGEKEIFIFADGTELPLAQSSHARDFGAPVQKELYQILAANPDVDAVCVETLRNGWLVGASVAQVNAPPTVDHGAPTLFRDANDDDAREWREGSDSFVGAAVFSFGESAEARAPLFDAADRMIGWLSFQFRVSHWLAAQAQPRALAYLIISLGLVVGQQRLAQLRRVRERDQAEARANALAQANELKSTFLAKVSHELRTPLQSFLGYTELLVSESNPRDRPRLLAMREHAGLMSRLVNDLIDLGAAECGQFQLIERPVAIGELVHQAAESLRPSAEAKGLAYSVAVAADLPAGVMADPQRVRQMVLNVVGNAIKYTDAGRIEVGLTCTARTETTATIALRVTDTGPGIAPEKQARLFSAFSRLEPAAGREGVGLGLAIVTAVCRAMGGDIQVESDGRSGSTFTACWCLRMAEMTATQAPERVSLHGKRVLVVDDNALVRDLFMAYLSGCGATCAAAGDGVEAIDRLHREPYDAVVLDLAMPRLNGFATVKELRRQNGRPQWRIVGVSAHASGVEHRDALAAGMDAFLTKPVSLPDLARALAPAASWLPPEPGFDAMRARFEQRFCHDARIQVSELAAAVASRAWAEVARLAHHLHNSAGVVGDAGLARGCAALEHAARASDAAAVANAWEVCRRTLRRWVDDESPVS